MKRFLTLLASAVLIAAPAAFAQESAAPVLIGHPSVPSIDKTVALRLYTGRAIEIRGMAVVVVNLERGNQLRERFMSDVLGQDDNKYIAYWTVRKHIGKGAPPHELASAAAVIEFVSRTPGAIGYIAAADLRPGMNVVLRP